MPAISATAPGKIILFGEHAVVYGRPAIAVPVQQVRARVVVTARPRGQPGEVRVLAPDIGLDARLADLSENQPLAKVIRSVLSALGISFPPACTVRVTSTIPVAAGMGSGRSRFGGHVARVFNLSGPSSASRAGERPGLPGGKALSRHTFRD